MNVSGNHATSVNNTYCTESANTNSLKSESTVLSNIKNVGNAPVLFKKNIISAKTSDRIQQRATDAKNAPKQGIPVSDKSTNEEQSKSNVFKNGMPKLIHFAWEGENISETDLANIFLNAMLSPDFSINIWTTKPSSILSTLDKMSNSENNAQYRFLARKFGPSISINDTKELYDELKTPPYYQRPKPGQYYKGGISFLNF